MYSVRTGLLNSLHVQRNITTTSHALVSYLKGGRGGPDFRSLVAKKSPDRQRDSYSLRADNTKSPGIYTAAVCNSFVWIVV